MEPCVENFLSSKWLPRIGWSAAVGALGIGLVGLENLIFLPVAALFLVLAGVCLWLSARPMIQVRESQLNIGERSVAWREIEAVGQVRLKFPLILRLKLTNSRRLTIVYSGVTSRAALLVNLICRYSRLARDQGGARRDQLIWLNQLPSQDSKALLPPTRIQRQIPAPAQRPAPLLSEEEENEIERMFQKLKAVGSLDARIEPNQSDED